MLQEEKFIPYTVSDIPPGPYLVFAPHPDDETFGMGGTIALVGQAGIAVHVVVLTDGQQAGDADIRRHEAQEAGRIIGLTNIYFWGLPDRKLHRVTDIESRVLKILKSVKPLVVFLPSLQEFHPDHRAATFKIWSTLQKLHYSGQLWTYEIVRQAEANRLIDITKVISIKQQAMRCYKSQLALNNYEAVVTGINQARALTLQQETTHAEAFFEYDGWRDSCPYTASLTTLKPYWQSDSMVEDSPLVSVIIRTKDRPRLLREALTSIAEQTYPNIEAVVVNDGGQDVESVVRDFRGALAKMQYVQHGANRGRPAAANTGIRKAEGEWICFLDADDWYYPDRLRWHAEWIRRDPGLDFLTGDYEYRRADGSLISTSMALHPSGREMLVKAGGSNEVVLGTQEIGAFVADHFGDIHTLSVPRETFHKLGGYPLGFKVCEDVHFLTRLCAVSSRVGVVCRPLGAYLIHGASATRADPLQAQEYNVQTLLDLKSLARGFSAPVQRGVMARLRNGRLNLGYALVKSGRRLDAIGAVLPSLIETPGWASFRNILSIMKG